MCFPLTQFIFLDMNFRGEGALTKDGDDAFIQYKGLKRRCVPTMDLFVKYGLAQVRSVCIKAD